MSATIHVEISCSYDAAEFLEFLAARGLACSVTSTNDHCELEIGFAVDPEVRLRNEFEAALASWLETRERPLIPVSDSRGDYVLRPPSD